MKSGKRIPPSSVVGPDATHGIRATYARGCRCYCGHEPPLKRDHSCCCRHAWRLIRRTKERERIRARKLEEARALLREVGEL